jgi:hypothetical protein
MLTSDATTQQHLPEPEGSLDLTSLEAKQASKQATKRVRAYKMFAANGSAGDAINMGR